MRLRENLFRSFLSQGQDIAASLKALRRRVEVARATDEAQRSLFQEILKVDDDMSKAVAYARLGGLGGRD